MISIQKNFIFVHIPKTGGNSIQSILSKYSEDEITTEKPHQDGVERFDIRSKYGTRKHTKLYEYKNLLDAGLYNRMFKFTITRNPWDRVISRYFFKKNLRKLKTGLDITRIDEERFGKNEFIKVIQSTDKLEDYILNEPKSHQIDFMRDTDIDYFIRMDNFQNDFDELCSKIDINTEELPKKNAGKHKKYQVYYDDELIQLVYTYHKN